MYLLLTVAHTDLELRRSRGEVEVEVVCPAGFSSFCEFFFFLPYIRVWVGPSGPLLAPPIDPPLIYVYWIRYNQTRRNFRRGGWGRDLYLRDLFTFVQVITFGTQQWDKLLTSRLLFRPTLPSSSGSSKRYYFEHLQLNSTQLKLSVSSAGRLPEDLQSLKSSLGLILVNLEDATIDLGWYTNLDVGKTL